jgi:hypothetical protein
MRPCPENREALALLALGELDSHTSTSLRHHLESCAGCQEYRTQLESLCAQLGRPPETNRETSSPVRLPSGFHGRLRARLREESALASPSRAETAVSSIPAQPDRRFIWQDWFSLPRFAAALILLALLSLWAWRPGPERPRTQPMAAPQQVRPEAGPASPPTLFAMSRALQNSMEALDDLLSRHESTLAANDPPTRGMGTFNGPAW